MNTVIVDKNGISQAARCIAKADLWFFLPKPSTGSVQMHLTLMPHQKFMRLRADRRIIRL